jgi:hypothetical protein
MNSFWRHTHWERKREDISLENHCVLDLAEKCREPATYDKVYETKFLWMTLRDKVPYCTVHAMREQRLEKIENKLYDLEVHR